jgi:hypothetical protein
LSPWIKLDERIDHCLLQNGGFQKRLALSSLSGDRICHRDRHLKFLRRDKGIEKINQQADRQHRPQYVINLHAL